MPGLMFRRLSDWHIRLSLRYLPDTMYGHKFMNDEEI